MRRLFTTLEAHERGVTRDALRWGERTGRWRRIDRGVWGSGPEDPSALDRARAAVLATGGVASGTLAGVLHGLDAVELAPPYVTVPRRASGRRPGATRRSLDPERVVRLGGVPCTDGPQTVVDLAAVLDDLRWEQALESALRKGIVAIEAIEHWPLRAAGRPRTRRVLAMCPAGAPPTESLLETLMVQLARTVDGLPPPRRQHEIVDAHDQFVARVDLAWPDLGLFVELDGEHHAGQPVYDARRETAVVAATGWLCGRFTWTEGTRSPKATARRLAALAEQARRRPLAS